MTYSWAELHGAVTHFPIAMIIGAFVFEVGGKLFKRDDWRVVGFWMLVVGVLGAAVSLTTGWLAGTSMHMMDSPSGTPFYTHRLLAFVSSGLALVALILRSAKKDPATGPIWATAALVLLLATATSSYAGFLGGKMVFGGGSAKPHHAGPATTLTASTTAPTYVPTAADIMAGSHVYADQGCNGCHVINGNGGNGGPDLSHEGTDNPDPNWQIAHLKNPQSKSPGSTMPPFNSLTAIQYRQLAAFLVSHK